MDLSPCAEFLYEDSSSSDDSDTEMILERHRQQMVVVVLAVKELEERKKKKRRGSTVGRLCIPRKHLRIRRTSSEEGTVCVDLTL